jgi:hypothetical protein
MALAKPRTSRGQEGQQHVVSAIATAQEVAILLIVDVALVSTTGGMLAAQEGTANTTCRAARRRRSRGAVSRRSPVNRGQSSSRSTTPTVDLDINNNALTGQALEVSRYERPEGKALV